MLIDVPSDLASNLVTFEYPDDVDLPSYKPTYRGNAKQVKQAVARIKQAARPVLYVGGGVVSSGASEELAALAELMRIPVVTTLMGKGAFPASHELNLGSVGMHGSKYANLAMTESDLVIAAGARFSDRVTGRLDEFAPHAEVIHIDIDPAEIGKVREVQIPIVGDLKGVLASIVATLSKEGAEPATAAWIGQIEEWRRRHPFYHPNVGEMPGEIVPETVMEQLSRALDPARSIVVTEVGQHQMWAAQHVDREVPRSFISSGGLGTMGFGFPAAVGAAIGCPDKTVVCVAGDGSFQMNSQEMATAAINRVPVKVLVMDNRCLGMVHQWQHLFYEGRYSSTLLDANPDFVKLADAYGWQAERVERPEDVEGALARMLAAEGPCLLDVAISRDQNVFPMVAPGKALNDVIGAIDVAVGAVRTDMPGNRRRRRPEGGRAMKHVLSVLVENKPGVLSRVTGLISRRGFNIESLSVGPTEDPTMSRVTAIVKADDVAYEQITKQLHKLISVHKITDLTDEGAIERELALYKVNAASERRSEIIEIANIFRAKIVDVGRGSLTIEATGDEEKLKGLEDLLRAYGIKEIVRTGKIAMSRNSKD